MQKSSFCFLQLLVKQNAVGTNLAKHADSHNIRILLCVCSAKHVNESLYPHLAHCRIQCRKEWWLFTSRLSQCVYRAWATWRLQIPAM